MVIVIVGMGIVGVSTAYNLVELGHKPEEICLIEATPTPFEGASGFAGGFLTSNWYSNDILELGNLSLALHRELAHKQDGASAWGYSATNTLFADRKDEGRSRPVDGQSKDWLLVGTSRAMAAQRDTGALEASLSLADLPAWLRVEDVQAVHAVGQLDAAAQVDPLRLCQFLLDQCKRMGCHIFMGNTVAELMTNGQNQLEALRLTDGQVIPCKSLVISSGPWSSQVVKQLFPKSEGVHARTVIRSVGGHSIVIKTPKWDSSPDGANRNLPACHAVFSADFTTTDDHGRSVTFAPEIFSRLPDEIYVAGLNTTEVPLPARADVKVLDDGSISALTRTAASMLAFNDPSSVPVVRQAFCFRPVTDTGKPIISRLPDKDLADDCAFQSGGGAWFCAGHGPWGISLSQGTGRVLAEMVLGMEASIDMSPFSLTDG